MSARKPSEQEMALIGAGPAGLAAARNLQKPALPVAGLKPGKSRREAWPSFVAARAADRRPL